MTRSRSASALATSGPGRPARRLRRYSPFAFYAFASPWIIGFLLLTVVPFAYAFGLSFTNFDGLSGRWQWIGLDNYSEAIHDSDLRHALLRTALYIVVVVPLTTAGALGLALLVKRRTRGVTLYRTIYFLPAVLPVVATALMFRLLFDRDTGLVNATLERLGISDVFWLNDPTAFFVLVAMVSWSLGVGMMIFLAALQNTPSELMDAASVDGAGPLRRFVAITLPLLTPVILFQVVVGVIFATQTLVEPLLLAPTSTGVSSGGFSSYSSVPNGNRLYLVDVATQLFAYNRFGYASALMCILFLMLLVISVVLLRSSRRWVFYGGPDPSGRP